jgi:hypothetical protein
MILDPDDLPVGAQVETPRLIAENNRLRSRLHQAEAEAANLRQTRDAAVTGLLDWKAKSDRRGTEILRFHQEASRSQAEAERTKADNDRLRGKVRELEAQKPKSDEAKRLKADIQRRDCSLARLQDEITRVRAEGARIQAERALWIDENSRFRIETKQLRDSIAAQWQAEFSHLNTEIIRLQVANAALLHELETLKEPRMLGSTHPRDPATDPTDASNLPSATTVSSSRRSRK